MDGAVSVGERGAGEAVGVGDGVVVAVAAGRPGLTPSQSRWPWHLDSAWVWRPRRSFGIGERVWLALGVVVDVAE